jgi:glycosyltransferase involved in cell wall biosynthesis
MIDIPKFSIIIPTADRPETLKYTLMACVMFKRDDLEIIISDNYSGPDTTAVIESFSDPRIKVFRTDRRLHMPAHWEFAVHKASGQYVIINCDDDFPAPNLLDSLDKVLDAGAPQIISWSIGLYHHPDFILNGTPNSLTYMAGHSNYALKLSPKKLIKNFHNLNFSYFPEATRSCIKRTLLLNVMNRVGSDAWRPYPDFTPSVLCLLEIDEEDYVYIDALLGCGGRSERSNAAAFSSEGKARGNPARASTFWAEVGDDDLYPNHPLKIPFYYNGHLAALSTAAKFYPDRMKRFQVNYEKFIRTFYEEVSGIRPNPFVGAHHIDDIKQYAQVQTGNSLTGNEKSYIKAQDITSTVRPSLKQRSIRLVSRMIPTKMKVALMPAIMLPAQHSVTVSGDAAGFTNGFEMNSRWEDITKKDDPLTFKTLEGAESLGLLISASRLNYNPD